MRRIIIGVAVAAVPVALWLAADVSAGPEKSQTASAAGGYPALAAKKGIAARYLRDEGIEADSAVVFRETFEDGAISDLDSRWTSVSNKDLAILSFLPGGPPETSGKRFLQMLATKGHDTGGHLWKLFEPGYDQLYARFYVKFAPDAPYVHHFVHMGAEANSPPYPMGGAGSRPSGSQRFSTGIDLGRDDLNPPGDWFLYTYWSEMHSWQTDEGESDGRPNAFYGNPFGPVEPERALRDKWQCVEFMIKCNTAPDKRDGEEAFWIDGRLIGRYATGTITGTWLRDKFHQSGVFNTNPKPFEGFLWRTTTNLKINWFWLLYYMDSVFANDWRPSDPTIPYNATQGRVYFDDIVIATDYIGPLATEPPGPDCDINGDGNANVIDVIKLIQLCLKNPQDTRGDYNGDGNCTISDAFALLVDILEGNC